jgi:hypothetical protein
LDFNIDNKNHTLDQNTLENRLKDLAAVKKNKGWIRNDLTTKQSGAIGRRFWIIAKHFQWIRSLFYHVNLSQTRAILVILSPQIQDKAPDDLRDIFQKALVNFNAIAPRHRVDLLKSTPQPSGPTASPEIDKKITETYESYRKAFEAKFPLKEIPVATEDEDIGVFWDSFMDRMSAQAYNEEHAKHLRDCQKYYTNFFKKTPKNKDAWVISEGKTDSAMAFDQFFANFLKETSTAECLFPEPDFIKNSFDAAAFFDKFFNFPSSGGAGSDGKAAQAELESLFECKIESYEELKTAYKKWALKNHPDKVSPGAEAEATAKFQKVGQWIKELRAAKKWD